MASKLKDGEIELSEKDICFICNLQVPLASKARHEGSYLHQAALQIAATALERLRTHVAPMTKTMETGASEEKEVSCIDKSTTFCSACACVVPFSDRARHVRTKTHLTSALDDQVFDELVRGYVGAEELNLLETLSRDPCDEEEGLMVEEWDATEIYTCYMCALDIPKVFKEEHELSSRHRGCVALANAASRRTVAFLIPTPMCVDAPTKTHEEKMVALLRAYVGVDIKRQHTETNEETVVRENDGPNSEIKRLTSREYFTEIMPLLQYIGGFFTLIIDNTDYVTIKTEKETYLRVHVANFNGLYTIGGTEEYKMKCRMCDCYNAHVSYSSKGHLDRLHVMSLGHIKHVLTPLESIHAIRKIDNNYSLCVLCSVLLPTHSVEQHTMKDIQHTASLAEALERGRDFKETKDDIKFLIYTSPPVDTGFFRNPPHNVTDTGFRLAHNLPSNLQNTGFGISGPFGQVSSSGAGSIFGQSNTGQSVPFGQSKTGQNVPFGQSNNGQSVPFGQSKTGQSVPFGQSYTGQSVPFGQSKTGQSVPFGQSNTGQSVPFGQSKTGQSVPFGQSNNGQCTFRTE